MRQVHGTKRTNERCVDSLPMSARADEFMVNVETKNQMNLSLWALPSTRGRCVRGRSLVSSVSAKNPNPKMATLLSQSDLIRSDQNLSLFPFMKPGELRNTVKTLRRQSTMMEPASSVKPMGHEEELHDVDDTRGRAPRTKALNLGPMVDWVLEQIHLRVTITNIRSLFSCIGVGEAQPFNVPPQHQMLARLKTNGNFFLTNYLLVSVSVFFFLLLFFHRIQLLVCILVACGWYIVLTKKHSELDHLVVMGKRIGEEQLLLGTTAVTIIFLVFFIMPTIMFSFSTSGVGCAIHALLRNNRLKDDGLQPVFPNKVGAKDEGENLV